MAGEAPVTGAAWPLPPAHYMRAKSLVPPPPPTDPLYATLASTSSTSTSPLPPMLEEIVYDMPLGVNYKDQISSISEIIGNLVPAEDVETPKDALKLVNQALLLSFVRLVNALAEHPSQPTEPHLDTLRQYLIAMHQLLNAYRPHQARQTAIALLDAQCARRRKFLESLKKRLQKSKTILNEARNNLAAIDTNPPELADRLAHAPDKMDVDHH